MKETKKLKKEIENWISNNGACSINIKKENQFIVVEFFG